MVKEFVKIVFGGSVFIPKPRAKFAPVSMVTTEACLGWRYGQSTGARRLSENISRRRYPQVKDTQTHVQRYTNKLNHTRIENEQKQSIKLVP